MDWHEIWANAVDWDQIGATDHPGLNPPQLSQADLYVLEWYGRHVSMFTKDFNLIPMFIEAMQLPPGAQELLIKKLSMIYDSNLRMVNKNMQGE